MTHGSENALKLIMETFCNPGDKVFIPLPNYPGFIHKAELYKADCILLKFDGDFKRNKLQIESSIKSSRIIYFSSPNLPFGYVVDSWLLAYVREYPNKMFIVDEAYFEYGPYEHSMFNSTLYPNLLVVRTFSKAFALAGARIGYILAHPSLIKKLEIAHCAKDITDHSVELCLNALIHRDYYLNQVAVDKENWKVFFSELDLYINPGDSIHKYHVGYGPYFLLFTKYPDYICKLFEKNKYLIRNKTDDLGEGCVRISLNIQEIMVDLLEIIKKINGYSCCYEMLFIDIDNTIRSDHHSEPVIGVVDSLRELSNHYSINYITDNASNNKDLHLYFEKHNIPHHKILSAFNMMNITTYEYTQGYFIRTDKLYVTKFPNITYELMKHIKTHACVYAIENSITESSIEQGYSDYIEIPFVGAFQSMLDTLDLEVEFIFIGKMTRIFPTTMRHVLVIGDSPQDYVFARNNNFYFKHVPDCTHINTILKNIMPK